MFVSVTSWKSSSGPSKPPEMDEYEQGHTWPHGKFTHRLGLRACKLPIVVYVWVNDCLSLCVSPVIE